ncbi:hypothetical protein [Anaerococcus hydrogenalis]|uniref:LPXTG-motif protein cell wall anchor domain protein n=1 Tax=Anaerococcus hydrogenalis TaxID=33029 RepID=A0A2N6UIM7_9FIRM|nr:hypothetical protein [Anaerococcus hydrogenalis]MDK7694877.1 hypothetical protein [Anaerococcus hydrogenalis]MDK7696569.1 hypothetical protein [Anaerococcus hydrogenalis]MDK7707904.1 hypothetical protein [Anaerococcus hydrogenalis]PMC81510.1 hypothetical protein CJ192_05640 [Anaerococcus hydrogenalis]
MKNLKKKLVFVAVLSLSFCVSKVSTYASSPKDEIINSANSIVEKLDKNTNDLNNLKGEKESKEILEARDKFNGLLDKLPKEYLKDFHMGDEVNNLDLIKNKTRLLEVLEGYFKLDEGMKKNLFDPYNKIKDGLKDENLSSDDVDKLIKDYNEKYKNLLKEESSSNKSTSKGAKLVKLDDKDKSNLSKTPINNERKASNVKTGVKSLSAVGIFLFGSLIILKKIRSI